MEMNMGKFSEKLVELLELAKKKRMYWNTRKSMTSLRTSHWELNRWRKYLTFWKPVEWMCLGLQTVMQMI